MPLADLSPSSRLAVREEKRKKVSAIQRVGEQMLRQSSREHREMMEATQREHSQLIQVLNTAQDREDATNHSILGLFREALGALSEMSRSMNASRERRERELHVDRTFVRVNDPSDYNLGTESSIGNRRLPEQAESTAMCSAQNRASRYPIEMSAGLNDLQDSRVFGQTRREGTSLLREDELYDCSLGNQPWSNTTWTPTSARAQVRHHPMGRAVTNNPIAISSRRMPDSQLDSPCRFGTYSRHNFTRDHGSYMFEEGQSQSLLTPRSFTRRADNYNQEAGRFVNEDVVSQKLWSARQVDPSISQDRVGEVHLCNPNMSDYKVNNVVENRQSEHAAISDTGNKMDKVTSRSPSSLSMHNFLPLSASTQNSDLDSEDGSGMDASQPLAVEEVRDSLSVMLYRGHAEKCADTRRAHLWEHDMAFVQNNNPAMATTNAPNTVKQSEISSTNARCLSAFQETRTPHQSESIQNKELSPMADCTQVDDLNVEARNCNVASTKNKGRETGKISSNVSSPGPGGKRAKKKDQPVQEQSTPIGRGKRQVKRKVIFSPSM